MPKKKSLLEFFAVEKLDIFNKLLLMVKNEKDAEAPKADEDWSAEQFKGDVVALLNSIKGKKLL